ncbi:hypothetical protein ABTC58_15980 [Acinetobacter baumannii]|jgi:hypothetical protein|nr:MULTISPECIES: hypothetical protein [Acinetobacter calcoaceticus/baumannii complex]EPG34007.1 hypothetical protein F910_03915 [Acinetobacter baumannii NIPH 410]MDQ8940337.1 hypothetical protein [Acinetobacter baumannii]MDQ9997254.1 hypothetical protein [Acinetobacter baumannii]OCR44857.1 hypothetical protein A4220_19115 [Acinetobacter pittii]QEY06132.1 hypothetical protein ABCAM1_3796 [Acinetobacter baumannii]
MVMNNIEYDAVVESAKIKAKSDITVAVLNNAASTGLVAINDASKEKLIEFIHKDLKCKAPLIEPNLRRNLDKWST